MIETQFTHNGKPDYPTVRTYGDTHRWQKAESYTYTILDKDGVVYLRSESKFSCGGKALASALARLKATICTDTSSGTAYYTDGDEVHLLCPT